MGDIIIIHGQRHVVWQCGSCGVWGTCPEIVYDQHHAEGGYHFCPNGHQWGWSKTTCEREKLRRERDRLKQQLACKDDEIEYQRKQVSAQKAQVTKLKKRAKNGVCPCCNRSFSNLKRHMDTQHPEFGPDNVVPLHKDTA